MISIAVGGSIERDLSVERLRQRLGELLRRYVPPSTLPTPIASGNDEFAEQHIADDSLARRRVIAIKRS